MKSATKKSDTTLASLIHLSTFSKYFILLGNFIFPLIIWSIKKKDRLIDVHAIQALNFQISLFLYMAFLAFATIAGIIFTGITLGLEDPMLFSDNIFRNDLLKVLPVLIITGVSGTLLLGLFILEIISVITATIKASEGNYYKYPLSIPFINSSNQSTNEQSNT